MKTNFYIRRRLLYLVCFFVDLVFLIFEEFLKICHIYFFRQLFDN